MGESQEGGEQSVDPRNLNFQLRIPVEWADGEGLDVLYANQLVISHGGPEFFMVFGVLEPPPVGTDVPDKMIIRPVAKIAVSREAMPGFVHAMHENLQRWRAAQSAMEEAQRKAGQ
jgi:hypothetical protein